MNSHRKELGQYPTPVWVAESLVDRHFSCLDAKDFVLEPACGPGAFLSAIPSYVPAIGIDIDPNMTAAARLNTGRFVMDGDFREIKLDIQPTVIIGNPPFNMALVDGFLERAYRLLPEGGRVGFILPAFAFQTASRVAGYADRWSLFQEMIPRNIFHGLSLPLVFAIFGKDRRRTMIGFALYRETADVQALPHMYKDLLSAGSGPVWRNVVAESLRRLGGEADLKTIYDEIEGVRPSRTRFWKEKVRQTLRRYGEYFLPIIEGRYRLASA